MFSTACRWLYSCPLPLIINPPRLSSPSRLCPGDSNKPWSPPRLPESSRPKSAGTRSSWRDAYHQRCLQTWAGKMCDGVCWNCKGLGGMLLIVEMSITDTLQSRQYKTFQSAETQRFMVFCCCCSLSYVFWRVCHNAVSNIEPVQRTYQIIQDCCLHRKQV